MIPASFEYQRARSIDHALALLNEYGEDAKLLAGGQSLLPIMKLRLAAPELVIDLGRLRELSHLRVEGSEIVVGALVRHSDLEFSSLLSKEAPLLRHAAGAIGDCQIRHRGTIGGAVAHGDPAADLPAALMALRAQVVLLGSQGRRTVPIDDFYQGFLETAIQPGELLVEVRLPRRRGDDWGFQKFRRRSIDWAIVGVSYQGGPFPGVGLVNMGATTLRAVQAETALRAGLPREAAAELADADTSPPSDATATAEYRRMLSKVLLARALTGQRSS